MTESLDHRFPCQTCGSDMRYAPGTDTLVCDHCGNTDRIQGSAPHRGALLQELDFQTALRAELPAVEMEESRVLRCPNCGAEVEFSPDEHAAECPFCATPVVTHTGTHRHIKPKGVLPFLLAEDAAREAMNQWLGKLWFAPNGLQDYARKGRRMQGIYVPYWTFDADTRTRYTGQRGTVHYESRTVTVNGERREQRVAKVRWTPVSGRVARFFDDVLVLASRSLPKDYTDAIAPWDLSGLEPYQPEYLAGFRAEGYTVDLRDGFIEARRMMDAMILRDIRFDIGGDRQQVSSVDTQISDVTFKHVLLPIWMAAYRYRGKSYRFVVNARTGRVRGERPWSAWKIATAVVLALIAAAALGFFVASQEGGLDVIRQVNF